MHGCRDVIKGSGKRVPLEFCAFILSTCCPTLHRVCSTIHAHDTTACMMTLPREVYESILQDVDLPVLCCLHLGLLGLKYPG
jgi:hypothetical protein